MTTSIKTQNQHWLAKRLPFYYGWVIVPISILGTMLTSPGQTFMVSVFNPSFRETFNLSLSQLTGAYMAGTILASLPQSYIGVWMDRLGIRKMLFMIAGMFGLACLFISQTRGLFMLFIAFFLLRTFGQGALELLSSNMLPMWFRQRLGTITGISGVVISLMIGVVPVVVLSLIHQIGWRTTYILAGVIVWLIMLPAAYFLFINRPEEIGQNIDGEPNNKEEEAVLEKKQHSLTLKEAMHTRSYWILIIVAVAWAAIGTGITFNLLPIFTAKGLTETQAAATFTTLMVVSAGTRLIGGWLADRIPLFWLSVISAFLYAFAIGAVLMLPTGWIVAIYTLLLGLGQGLFNGLANTVWVRYFGREHLGKIRGSLWTATVAGSSVGPFLLGFSYDHFGGFDPGLIGCAIFMLVLGVASFWARIPQARKAEL